MTSLNALALILLYTFSLMFFPWKDRVIFLWDDIEFLMQLRRFNSATILEVHEYQFHPLFNLSTWGRIQLSGVDATAFLLTAIFLHLINIVLLYGIIFIITRSRFFSALGALLVAFNKSYFTVIYWLAVHSNVMVTTILLLSILIFLKNITAKRQRWSLFAILLILAPLMQGFGIGAGFAFALATLLAWPDTRSKMFVVTISIVAGALSLAVNLPFLVGDVTQHQVFQFSLSRISTLVYFTAIGVTQALITKFVLPGFVPNVFAPANVGIMIGVPLAMAAVFAIALKNVSRSHDRRFLGMLLGLAFSALPYFIAGLGRSAGGGLGGLAERYIYLPFFFFIIAFVTALHVLVRKHLTIRIKTFIIAAALILSLGHQVALFKELDILFINAPL